MSSNYASCDFVHTFGNLLLYQNHLEQAREQFIRGYRSLPQVKLNRAVKNIHDLAFEDFELVDYDTHPSIKALIARIKKLFFCLSAARPLA